MTDDICGGVLTYKEVKRKYPEGKDMKVRINKKDPSYDPDKGSPQYKTVHLSPKEYAKRYTEIIAPSLMMKEIHLKATIKAIEKRIVAEKLENAEERIKEIIKEEKQITKDLIRKIRGKRSFADATPENRIIMFKKFFKQEDRRANAQGKHKGKVKIRILPLPEEKVNKEIAKELTQGEKIQADYKRRKKQAKENGEQFIEGPSETNKEFMRFVPTGKPNSKGKVLSFDNSAQITEDQNREDALKYHTRKKLDREYNERITNIRRKHEKEKSTPTEKKARKYLKEHRALQVKIFNGDESKENIDRLAKLKTKYNNAVLKIQEEGTPERFDTAEDELDSLGSRIKTYERQYKALEALPESPERKSLIKTYKEDIQSASKRIREILIEQVLKTRTEGLRLLENKKKETKKILESNFENLESYYEYDEDDLSQARLDKMLTNLKLENERYEALRAEIPKYKAETLAIIDKLSGYKDFK